MKVRASHVVVHNPERLHRIAADERGSTREILRRAR